MKGFKNIFIAESYRQLKTKGLYVFAVIILALMILIGYFASTNATDSYRPSLIPKETKEYDVLITRTKTAISDMEKTLENIKDGKEKAKITEKASLKSVLMKEKNNLAILEYGKKHKLTSKTHDVLAGSSVMNTSSISKNSNIISGANLLINLAIPPILFFAGLLMIFSYVGELSKRTLNIVMTNPYKKETIIFGKAVTIATIFLVMYSLFFLLSYIIAAIFKFNGAINPSLYVIGGRVGVVSRFGLFLISYLQGIFPLVFYISLGLFLSSIFKTAKIPQFLLIIYIFIFSSLSSILSSIRLDFITPAFIQNPLSHMIGEIRPFNIIYSFIAYFGTIILFNVYTYVRIKKRDLA